MNTELQGLLTTEGYTELKEIDGKVCGLYRFIYTVGLVVGMDEVGYKYRYCYPTYADAKEAIENYNDLSTHPSGNWIKRKGGGGDLPNPNIESEE